MTIAAYTILALTAVVLVIFLLLRVDAISAFFSKLLNAAKPLVYAFGIAYLLWPLMKLFENKVFAFLEKKKPRKKLVRTLSLICTYIIFLFVLGFVFGTMIPQLMDSITTLKDKINAYASTAQVWFSDLFLRDGKRSDRIPEWLLSFIEEQLDNLREYINAAFSWLTSNIANILSKATSYANVFANLALEVKNILLGIVFAIYFLLFKEHLIAQIKKFFHAIMPDKVYLQAKHYVTLTDHTFGGFIVGKLIDSLIIGLLCFIFMSIFMMPYAPLISMIVGITNIIPFFGPFIGAIPSAFIILIAEPKMTLWFIVLVFALQQLDGNVIGPKILGDFVGLSPLWIIVAITVMGGLFGLFGMFLGVPTFAVFYAIIKELTEKKLTAKSMPTDTEDYYRQTEYLEIIHPVKKEHKLPDSVQKRIPKKLTGVFRKKEKKDKNDKS